MNNIEVGDYVNGCYVEKVWQQINNKTAIDLKDDFLGLNEDEYIETVVTKQQFQAIEYKIGG